MSPLPRSSRWKLGFLGILTLGTLIGAFFVKPVYQDPAYHQLADSRGWLGIPNALNVLSNLPFVGAGLYGLCQVFRKRDEDFLEPWLRGPWVVLTGALFLTGFGSAYYHWAPTDATLFWDRLPMAIGFSAVLGILVAERADLALGRRLWAPLVLAAVGSLVFWRAGGDLRFYGLLQGWAIAFMPIILLLFPARYTAGWAWGLVLLFYGLAKVFELTDAALFNLGHIVSGHTLKHLGAGVAAFFISRHLAVRARMNSSDGTPARAA
ncbi:MAG TPA: alkaline phytoceramidase [Planctomycetota bacterium]|nr:alkaline phytoceramidase [Planctomycetota bacterium]